MENVLENNPMPRIGDKAPAFSAVTTQGNINFPEDYAGKWIILFSHPSDFTPICTSEFMTFANMQKDFDELNCQLVGLSVDGLASHIAWLRTIKEKIEFHGMKNIDVKFPLIEDIKMEVSNKYGMIQPGASDTKAVRAVFFIDPAGIIRAIIYYPLNLGRNFEELKRVVLGLQTADKFKVALPADWKPGTEVIVPAPSTSTKANERMDKKDSEMVCHDWFFCTKVIPKDVIEKEILKR
jgi:peroxiredoxin (alkyl hydroperoxide reductase subunit C)